MKKIFLLTALLAAIGVVNAAEIKSGSASATWDATAVKDTTSQLVVTPLGSIHLKYAEGIKSFNTQEGLFDVAVRGVPNATDFKLSAKLGSNTLNNIITTEKSQLNVGVRWKGQDVTAATPTVLVDTKNGPKSAFTKITSALQTETADQDSFTFYISDAKDGTGPIAFDKLPDGRWTGQVTVDFDAVWSDNK